MITGYPEAGPEGLEVLLGKDRRRNQNRDLLAREHCQEGGPDGDLGLAEPDVAAHQTVHRPGTAEVGEHLLDGALLPRRLLERKAGRELLVERVGRRVRGAGVGLAAGVDAHEVVRHGEDRFLGLGLDALPGRPAELVERRGGAVRAHVALHDGDAVDGHVEPVAAQVLEVQVVALRPRHLHVAEAAIDADSVVDVDDVVVGVQLGEGREEIRRLGTPATAHRAPFAEDLGLGHQHEAVHR